MIINGVKWTKRASNLKKYQTPYGEIELERHVHQTSKGGRIDCPLEQNARIIYQAVVVSIRGNERQQGL